MYNDWFCSYCIYRPESGCMLLYNRKKVSYRRDGYVWKKRKDGKSTRLDHMKLKILGVEVRNTCSMNSSILFSKSGKFASSPSWGKIPGIFHLEMREGQDVAMVLFFVFCFCFKFKLKVINGMRYCSLLVCLLVCTGCPEKKN